MEVGSLDGICSWLEVTIKEMKIMGAILVPDGSASSLNSQRFSM